MSFILLGDCIGDLGRLFGLVALNPDFQETGVSNRTQLEFAFKESHRFRRRQLLASTFHSRPSVRELKVFGDLAEYRLGLDQLLFALDKVGVIACRVSAGRQAANVGPIALKLDARSALVIVRFATNLVPQ